MSRLSALLDRIAHQPFPIAYWQTLQANVNYLVVAGADIAVIGAANTLAIASRFHRVTAGTGQIDSLADALGVSSGQWVELLFANPQTIRNNGGGAGNIRTASGSDLSIPANAIVKFVYDPTGTVWREAETRLPGDEIDYAQITATTAAISATTEGTATAVVTGSSKTYDGGRVRLEFFSPLLTGSVAALVTFVFLRDSTIIGQANSMEGSSGNTRGGVYAPAFDTPPAGAHTYSVKAFVSSGTVTVGAGIGGSGALVPAFLRATRA